MRSMSSALCTAPSACRKPAASSKSLPGVRMVTAMECCRQPCAAGTRTRISMGSSPATSSERSSRFASRQRAMLTRSTERPRLTRARSSASISFSSASSVCDSGGMRGRAFILVGKRPAQLGDHVAVSGNLREGRARAAGYQHVAFGPVHFQRASADIGSEHMAVVTPELILQHYRIGFAQTQSFAVGNADQYRVARKTSCRVALFMNVAVELFTTPLHYLEAVFRRLYARERSRLKMRLAVGGGKFPAGAQQATAVLEIVALPRQLLDAGIHRYHPSDFGADGGGVGEAEFVLPFGPYASRELHIHFPFGTRLADARAGYLGTEDDGPFGGGLGDTTGHLITGGRGQQQDRLLSRFDEHVRRRHDVEVHAQLDMRVGAQDALRIGQYLMEVAAGCKQDVGTAA